MEPRRNQPHSEPGTPQVGANSKAAQVCFLPHSHPQTHRNQISIRPRKLPATRTELIGTMVGSHRLPGFIPQSPDPERIAAKMTQVRKIAGCKFIDMVTVSHPVHPHDVYFLAIFCSPLQKEYSLVVQLCGIKMHTPKENLDSMGLGRMTRHVSK
jgi:hypothetical protein